MGISEQHSNSSYYGMQKQGVGVVNAGTRRPCWPCCATRLCLMSPFPCEQSGVPACTPFPTNGEGWGRGSRAPFPHIWGGMAKGREVLGAAYLHATPFHAKGEGWSWGWEGEEGGSGGRGDTERRGDVPSCAPLPREWGREGRWPASCAPFRTYGVSQTREKGRGGGQHGEVGRSAFARHLSAQTGLRGQGGRGGADTECPVHPPSMQMGKGGGQMARGKGWDQRWHALVRTPSARMGKGGARERGAVACPCAHSFCVNTNGGQGERERGVAALCAPSVRMGGMDKGEGRARGNGENRQRRDRVLHVNGTHGGRGQDGMEYPHVLPFCTNKVARTGGKGKEGGEVMEGTLFAHPILYELGGTQ
ncbi:hypothetical protein EDB92DRAFT_1822184 [Lactarius akahatsu]|uniref:Uncharacterized protein n=1 Tax=Lactarius akahatsu TaxID=416441 RepID=A0AAD4Q286_9AGAM|nr:hypothetical protein EDB92DRAFT_1822184 [Lactarius akahatsu]